VLVAYRRRDQLVAALHEANSRLENARICVLFHGPPEERQPSAEKPEAFLFNLLKDTDGVRTAASLNLAQLENPDLTAEARAQFVATLAEQVDICLVASPELRERAESLAAGGIKLIDVSATPSSAPSATAQFDASLGPEPIRSLYTGIIPLVFKTQHELLYSLQTSLFSSGLLIVIVMAIVFRSAMAGAVSMLPNLFPVILVFGTLGLLGVKMDIGIVMTASVALGVAVDSTVHLVTWFYHGQSRGLNRRESTLMAYDHCAAATVQGALISGLGLAVFAFSAFTPTKQFGYLMIVIQSTALLGDLVLLPALFCGPLGRFFERPARRGTAPPDDLAGLDPAEPDDVIPEMVEAGIPADSRQHIGDAPAPHSRRIAREEEPVVSPANKALRDKLRSFRRS
jgi:uncharacterized protein